MVLPPAKHTISVPNATKKFRPRQRKLAAADKSELLLFMLDSVVNIQELSERCLGSLHQFSNMLTEELWKIRQNLVHLLKIFTVATEALNWATCPTISLVLLEKAIVREL